VPSHDLLAVTMTGELCDCFATRREGVQAILSVVEAVASATPRIWLNDGRFVEIREARDAPLQVASANWLALAAFAGRYVPKGAALLVDVGSTTIDVIPLFDGIPQPRGRTDLERLTSGELLYTGTARTPLFAVLPFVLFRGRLFRLLPELFATMKDVYLMLGHIPEDPVDHDTADGRPATKLHALGRIARHFGLDADDVSPVEVEEVCRALREEQLRLVAEAISSVAFFLSNDPPATIRSGAGEFLIRAALQRLEWTSPSISLAEHLGSTLSVAAPAYAVAVLAAEQRA
jgi:probable H4MPT-linked C1 transfer pathway protein